MTSRITVRAATDALPAGGVQVRHRTARSQVVLIPLLYRPLSGDSLYPCNVCKVTHPVQTLHLYVDDAGGAIVSTGVLSHLRRAGLPDLDVGGIVASPPPLRVGGRRAARPQVDQANRKQTFWREPAGLIKKARLLRGGTR